MHSVSFIHACTCIFVCVSVCECMCVSVCVCVCVFLIPMMVITAETLYLAVVLCGDVASYNNYEL